MARFHIDPAKHPRDPEAAELDLVGDPQVGDEPRYVLPIEQIEAWLKWYSGRYHNYWGRVEDEKDVAEFVRLVRAEPLWERPPHDPSMEVDPADPLHQWQWAVARAINGDPEAFIAMLNLPEGVRQMFGRMILTAPARNRETAVGDEQYAEFYFMKREYLRYRQKYRKGKKLTMLVVAARWSEPTRRDGRIVPGDFICPDLEAFDKVLRGDTTYRRKFPTAKTPS